MTQPLKNWSSGDLAVQFSRRKTAASQGKEHLNDLVRHTYIVMQRLHQASNPAVAREERDRLVELVQSSKVEIGNAFRRLVGSVNEIEDSKCVVEEMYEKIDRGEFVPEALPEEMLLRLNREKLQRLIRAQDEKIYKIMHGLEQLQTDLDILNSNQLD